MCLLAYRIHSIFVLRLFNDPIAMTFLYISIVFLLRRQWTLACILYRFDPYAWHSSSIDLFSLFQRGRVHQDEYPTDGSSTFLHPPTLHRTSGYPTVHCLLRSAAGKFQRLTHDPPITLSFSSSRQYPFSGRILLLTWLGPSISVVSSFTFGQ